MHTLDQLNFDNTYAALPDAFHARLAPMPLQGQRLLHFNPYAAELLNLAPTESERPDFVDRLTGAAELPGSSPVAMAYAGHQFGHYVPQLGDGRAVLLGEVLNGCGERWDLHLKGAGETPYSRSGDGRAVLRSSIREYLCSEAMHALGIPSTRALCLIDSDQEVYREQIERGAMILRMSPSHVRFGSFEYLFYSGRYDELRQLGEYVCRLHYPDLLQQPDWPVAMLREVVHRTARLVAQWQLLGFAHGVLNTDNMSILGLTLDYGPYGFMETYEPGFICNHSDHHGRYAFDQQPSIGLWNLSCLAQAMLPIIGADDGEGAAEQARAVLDEYEGVLLAEYAGGMRAKLGLLESDAEDQQLVSELLAAMEAGRVDYTNLFRALSRPDGGQRVRSKFSESARIDAWIAAWHARLAREGRPETERSRAMLAANPKYILRNYLAQQAISAAEAGDPGELERLFLVLRRPYEEQPEYEAYAEEAPAWAAGLAVSCSS